MTSPLFPTFDESIAERVRRGHDDVGGLPAYLGIRLSGIGPGWATCELEVTAELLNPFGAAHGGVISALVDHSLGLVCVPVIPPGSWPATMEYKLNLVGPSRTGPMTANAKILALRGTTAVVRIDVDNDGRLVGAAQGTVAIVPPRNPGTARG